jgi:SulP family sulfate permease
VGDPLKNTNLSDDTMTPLQSFRSSLINPRILFPNLTAAVIVAIINVSTSMAIAALVFSGTLTPYLSMGIGLFFIGTLIGGVLVPMGSGYHAIVASPRGGQAPIFAAMAAAVVIAMEGQPLDNIAITVVVTILAATVFTGLLMFILGWAKLGTLARYIPFPVMGGFFAGLGYLLSRGGIIVAVGPLGDRSDLLSFIQPSALLHLAPALGFAVLLLTTERFVKHWFLMPGCLVIFVAVFYGFMWANGMTIAAASAVGWLPNYSVNTSSFFPVITPSQLTQVDWLAILAQSGTILVLALLSVIMLLLDVSAVEIAINRDLDPNDELKATGLANVIGGLATGPLAFQVSADTALAHKLGADKFLMIVFYGLLVFGVILVGPAPIAFIPTFILGGMLLYLGLGFLIDWVWRARKKLPLADLVVVCCILFFVARYGILEGVGAGIVLATVLFVHKCSQLSVVKTRMSGDEHDSNIDRHKEDQAYLDQNGSAVQIFILQGYLFFGTAARLLEQIKNSLDGQERSDLRFMVLDFRRVEAIDISAVNSFTTLIQLCNREGISLIFTVCSAEFLTRLTELSAEVDIKPDIVHFFDDLDEGHGWCSDEILKDFTRRSKGDEDKPDSLLAELLGDRAAASVLLKGFKHVEIPAGQRLFEQGDPGNSLYLILKGSVSVILSLPEGPSITVRTMRDGAILGEMALYTGAPRSASAEAKQDCVLYQLDLENYDRLKRNNPVEFGQFHAYIVRLMSERLGRANREILALSR